MRNLCKAHIYLYQIFQTGYSEGEFFFFFFKNISRHVDLLKNEILHQLSVGNMELRRTKNPLFFTEGFNVLIIIQQIFIKN